MFKLIKENGIKTICLDESHHLQNEWQKALEKFIKALDKDTTIISLTATPPYDAKTTEWQRYISVCGEIDEEIFVPELVKQGTLCPHQDYVLFNYPTEEEITEVVVLAPWWHPNKLYNNYDCKIELLSDEFPDVHRITYNNKSFLHIRSYVGATNVGEIVYYYHLLNVRELYLLVQLVLFQMMLILVIY